MLPNELATIRNVLGNVDLFFNVLRDSILPPDALLLGVKPSHLANDLAELNLVMDSPTSARTDFYGLSTR